MKSEMPILQSIEIIENRISEKLTVKNIADSVHFSQYHYGRLFRELIGESVMDYVIKRKLTLAGKELMETNATILDIALKYGYDYSDESD
jgi:AraC family transcriptional regulator